MLTFNLKKQWYEKIASGEKRIEYREVKPYWTVRLCKFIYPKYPTSENISKFAKPSGTPCRIVLGYTKRYMTAKITKVEVVDGKNTDLKINAPVYAIHLSEVREAER